MEFLQQNWHWALVAFASGGFLVFDTIRSFGNKAQITPLEATLMINREDAAVIDVRDQGEFAQGHVPNARNVPLAELDKRSAELQALKAQPIILCCASGTRSNNAATKLRKAGFDKIFTLAGGIYAWEKSGQPVATGRKVKGKEKSK